MVVDPLASVDDVTTVAVVAALIAARATSPKFFRPGESIVTPRTC
jgi:hypothetical protein